MTATHPSGERQAPATYDRTPAGMTRGDLVFRALAGVLGVALVVAGALMLAPDRSRPAPVLTTAVADGPTAVFVDGHRVWVASQAAGVVSVLDRTSGRVLDAVRTGGAPARLAGAVDGVWVADSAAGAVFPITARPLRRYGRIRVGADVSDVALAAGAVWSASSAESVVRVRGRDGRAARELPAGARPIALAADARWVAVANSGDGTVTRIDARRRRLAGPAIRVGGTPIDIAVDGDRAWVLDAGSASVTRVDLRTGALGPRVDVGRRPVAVAAADGEAYVVSARDRNLVRIADGKVRARTSLRAGAVPTALALDPAHVWVTDIGDDTVRRYDR